MKFRSEVTARIRQAESGRLWLFIDQLEANRVSVEDVDLFTASRMEDEAGSVAYAILPAEVAAIRDACNAWLNEQDADIERAANAALEAHAN